MARSLVRWPGGKWYIKKDILPHVPPMTGEVVSPFLGGGHVEVALASRGVRVHGSDIYRPLVVLWNALLNQPHALADRLAYHVGDEFPISDSKAQELIDLWHEITPQSDDLDIAVALFCQTRMGYGSFVGARFPRSKGWYQGIRQWGVNGRSDKVIREFRLPGMSVEETDYRVALARHPRMFAYCDPPYRIDTFLYGSKGHVHKAFDHEAFAATMLARSSPWIISYNDCDWVRDAFKGCEFHEVAGKYGLGKAFLKKNELVILGGDHA